MRRSKMLHGVQYGPLIYFFIEFIVLESARDRCVDFQLTH